MDGKRDPSIIGESSSAGYNRVKRFTVAIHPENRSDTEDSFPDSWKSDNMESQTTKEDEMTEMGTLKVVLPIERPLAPASDTELKPPMVKSEIPDTKSFKYWANKVTHAFRNVTSGTKRRKNSLGSLFSTIDSEFDEFDGPTARFKPEAIDTLCQLTKFNRRELQLMYRGFKQECPSGMVREETFKGIYAQFFPRGSDTSQYAHYVFNTFDQDHTGSITFTDFVIGLSVLARGSLQEKLRWVFSLYDINGDGYITKDEMSRIVSAVYDIMGKSVEPALEENTTREHVERVFQKLDLNQDGVVTIDEFMDSCSKDDNITKSMTVFNTVL